MMLAVAASLIALCATVAAAQAGKGDGSWGADSSGGRCRRDEVATAATEV